MRCVLPGLRRRRCVEALKGVPWEGISAAASTTMHLVLPPSTSHPREGREGFLLCLFLLPEHLWSREQLQQELRDFPPLFPAGHLPWLWRCCRAHSQALLRFEPVVYFQVGEEGMAV